MNPTTRKHQPLTFFTAAAMALLLTACDWGGEEQQTPLERALNDERRTEAWKARDRYRHPRETLQFMGIEPDMTVVELWPGGGWYTQILAPYLQGEGMLYLAQFPADSERDYQRRLRREQGEWLQQAGFSIDFAMTTLGPGQYEIAPAGSADAVLTFRNLHNWLAADYLEEVYRAAWNALKPGGTFGVVEHRAPPGTDLATMKRSGYVTVALAKEVADRVGFVLVAESEINANPLDTADHPQGVWTLPPSLRVREGQDRDKYLAIGESDRMTLRFVKPAS